MPNLKAQTSKPNDTKPGTAPPRPRLQRSRSVGSNLGIYDEDKYGFPKLYKYHQPQPNAQSQPGIKGQQGQRQPSAKGQPGVRGQQIVKGQQGVKVQPSSKGHGRPARQRRASGSQQELRMADNTIRPGTLRRSASVGPEGSKKTTTISSCTQPWVVERSSPTFHDIYI